MIRWIDLRAIAGERHFFDLAREKIHIGKRLIDLAMVMMQVLLEDPGCEC